jgi:hypothetical protein
MTVVILSRDDWGADPALPRRGHPIGPKHRTEVFLHHSVVVDADATPNEWESLDEVKAQMRRMQTIRPDLGLDVPYNFVAFAMADGDLVLGEGRGLGRTGAHTRGHNRSALGIGFQGNFEHEPLPTHFEAQLAELGGWLRRLREEEGFSELATVQPTDPERPQRQVFGHREVKSTDCPGRHLWERLHLIQVIDTTPWREPGDPIRTSADEERVFAAHRGLKAQEVPPSTRRALAVILDRQMQLEARVGRLEGGNP